MNEELLYLFRGLNEVLRAQVCAYFAHSPRAIRYLLLLEEEETTSTSRIVAHIYSDLQDTVDRRTLVNRFYKLRSRVRIWMLQQVRHNTLVQTPEEQELTFLRLLVVKNEHAYALPRLQDLIHRCWALNLFELLPEVLRLTIRTARSCEAMTIEEQKTLNEELKEANRLRALLAQMQETNIYLVLNIEEYSSKIGVLRRQKKGLDHYPRFTLIYHYIGFCLGVYRADLVERTSGSMVRHLNAFQRLREKHPTIPVLESGPYHLEQTETIFYIRAAIFWYYKNQPKNCMQALQKRQLILKQTPNFTPNINSADLHNMIYFCIYAKDYSMARSYIEELVQYQDANASDHMEVPAHIYNMIVAIECYPESYVHDPLPLINEIEEFLTNAAQASAWASVTLAEFALLYGHIDRAAQALQHPHLPAYMAQYAPLPFYIEEVVAAMQEHNKTALLQLQTTLETCLKEESTAKLKFHYETTLHIVQQCILKIETA